MSMAQMTTKVPDWYIHLKLLTIQNPGNLPITIEKFIDSTFLPTRFLGLYKKCDSKENRALWKLYSWMMLLAISTNAIYCLYFYRDVFPSLYDEDSLYLCLDRFRFFIANFSAAFCIFHEIISPDDYVAIFGYVSRVDVVLLGLGLEVKFSYLKSFCSLIFRMTVIGVFSYMYGVDLLFNPVNATGFSLVAVMNVIGMSFTLCIVSAMEYQHSEIMGSVAARFKIIKDRVLELGSKSRAPTQAEMMEFESLVKAYNQLNEACIILNNKFGKQILFVVGTIFATVTSSANHIVQDLITLITQRTISSSHLFVQNIYLGSARFLELWFILAACDKVVERAKEFTAELYQVMIDDDSLQMSKNKKVYLHISSQTEPKFTAYGFFALDNALLHSVVAAATTYIIILIQFSQTSAAGATLPSTNTTQTTTKTLFSQ